MKTYNAVFDIVRNQVPAKKQEEWFDVTNFFYYLLLRRPGESFKDGFLVWVKVPVGGIDLYANRNDSVKTASLVFGKFLDQFDDMYSAAFPYIEDGCVEVAMSDTGPWTNLMLEEL